MEIPFVLKWGVPLLLIACVAGTVAVLIYAVRFHMANKKK